MARWWSVMSPPSLDALLRDALVGLLLELAEGPPGDLAFVVNPGDHGVLGSLAALSAFEASARPNGRSSVAAHVQHLQYGFQLLNRWIRGDDHAFSDADYAQSWGHQQVTDEQWRELRDALEREVRAWMSAVGTPRDWDPVTLGGTIGSVAHLAYHLGAIRQLVASASGPPARD
jgi:hypothetical protein